MLTEQEAALLTSEYRMLPGDYLSYLVLEGWGKTRNGKMLYSGPICPEDVYSTSRAPVGLLVLGDDFSGYCFAYDPAAGVYGELDAEGCWEPWPVGVGLDAYVGK
jgi:hypothetical protein